MSFSSDIMLILSSDSVGRPNINLFRSTAKVLPTGAGPWLTIIDTGGTSPEETQESTQLPAYQRPGAQLVVRSSSYPDAYAMARAAYNSLAKIRNQFVGSDPSFTGEGNSFIGSGGTWYARIRPTQEPFDMGLDNDGRVRVAFNVLGFKRPSYQ